MNKRAPKIAPLVERKPSVLATIERLRGDTPKSERKLLTNKALAEVYKRSLNDRKGEVERGIRCRESAISKLIDDVLDATPTTRKEKRHRVTRAEYARIKYKWERDAGHLGRAHIVGKVIEEVWAESERPYDSEEQRKANKRKGRKGKQHKDWSEPMTDWERSTQEMVRLLREENKRAKESEGEMMGLLRAAARYSVPQLIADFGLDPDLEAACERWLMTQFGEVMKYAAINTHRVLLEFDDEQSALTLCEWADKQQIRNLRQPSFLGWLEESRRQA